MNRERFSDRAIVINVSELRESDLLVSLLCRSHGRLCAVARGARRSQRRFAGGIDLFDCGRFELEAPARDGGLSVLHELSERVLWLGLREDLEIFSLASVATGIAATFATESSEGSCQLFDGLETCLSALATRPAIKEAHAVTATLAATVLWDAGLDPLAEQAPLHRELRARLERLLAGTSVPEDDPKQLLLGLLRYTEQTTGCRIRGSELFLGPGLTRA